MDYFINPAMFQKSFVVPFNIAENYLKIATATQLRVVLYVLSHLSDEPSNADIADALLLTEADVSDAMCFWQQSGIFMAKSGPQTPAEKPEKRIVKTAVIKPTREEIARRLSESKEISLLLNEAQFKFGRTLKMNESSTLIWLYDDQGMDISLILMLLEYAKGENKCNISFIERTAVEWLNNNIASITDAENYIAEINRKKTAWKVVEAAFGIEDRLASTKELELASRWVEEWHLPREVLRLAYEKCVDTKSKFIMSYTAKILEGWHKNGYKTAADINNAEVKSKKAQKADFASSDISEIDKLLSIGYKGE